MDRRDFFRASAGTAVLAAIAPASLVTPLPPVVPAASTARLYLNPFDIAQDTFCQGERCYFDIDMGDGRAVRIDYLFCKQLDGDHDKPRPIVAGCRLKVDNGQWLEGFYVGRLTWFPKRLVLGATGLSFDTGGTIAPWRETGDSLEGDITIALKLSDGKRATAIALGDDPNASSAVSRPA